MDGRVLNGQGVGYKNVKSPYISQALGNADIFTNFKIHNLPIPEILRMENSTSRLRRVEIFDSIVCDPPYGIKAAGKSSKKTSSKRYNNG